MTISKEAKKYILDKLSEIEKKQDIKIIYAVESGSRLWGIDDGESDYDVRFVYVRPINEYLSIYPYRDNCTIVEGKYDFVGFDIKKFAKLLLKSNPTCIEWLNSSIKYVEKFHFYDGLKYHINYNCDLFVLFNHYISMGKANYHKYIENEISPNKKKFKYVIRALLCAKYITLFHSIPPENIMVAEYAYKYACGDIFLLNSEEEKIKKTIEYIQGMFDELEKIKKDVLEDRDRKIDYDLVNRVVINNIRYYGYASLSELGVVT